MLLAGTLLSFTFAPYNIGFAFSFLLMLGFYVDISQLSPKNGAIAGWLFGLGYFGLGVSWVYHSIYLFGGATVPLAAAVTLLFVLVMTVFPALCAWAFLTLKPVLPWSVRALVFASLWTLLELARGKIMGGFPWIILGYSQTESFVGSLAPLIGVYGISFFVAFLLPFLADYALVHRRHKQRNALYGVALFGLFCVVISLFGLNKVEFSTPKNTALQVRLVQANIPQSMKFTQAMLQESLQQYTQMSQAGLDSVASKVDLIIWPETAIPTYFDRVEQALAPFNQSMALQNIDVLAGGFYRDGDAVYNSVMQLGGEQALYQKRHLVPFGEYMPFRFLLDFMAAFVQIPMSDLSSGSGPHKPLMIGSEAIGLSICYEDVFGEEMRALLPDATLLVNVSNDAWFGESAAPHQHQQKAQMRAREFSRPMLRVTNTGISSVIDYRGKVVHTIAHNTKGVIDATVVPREGLTLYAKTGNWPVFLLSIFILFFALTNFLKQRR